MKNKQIYTFLITETIILVDGCKFSDKDGLDFTFIWVHDRADRSGGIRDRDEQEASPRGTGTSNTKWRLDYTARQGETSRVFLNLDHYRNFNLETSKSLNLINFFFMIRDDPSCS